MKGIRVNGGGGLAVWLVMVVAGVALLAAEEAVELAEFPVYGGGGFSMTALESVQVVERLEGEVRVDLQTRGSSRYQTDVSIRGGIFEGSGLVVGGLVVTDPQTGHYTTELPLDSGFFSSAQLLTGVSNSQNGFNATAGSIGLEWAALEAGGMMRWGVGSDGQWGVGLRQATRVGAGGLELAAGRESGDGSVENGDFLVERISGRWESAVGGGELRVFGGVTRKAYGWPGMYTGRPALAEFEDYTVMLGGWQWQRGRAVDDGWWHRLGGFWRELEDDYEFNRFTPNAFFEHRTRVLSLQGDGGWREGDWRLDYRWLVLRDEVVRSTSLMNGNFARREYGKAAVLLHREVAVGGLLGSVYGGWTLDSSSEDSTRGLPQLGIRLSGERWEAYLEGSGSSQVPGYTVLGSAPSGLFGGNADAGRELARSVEAGVRYSHGDVGGRLVVFRREDRGLIDWVFDSSSPNARRASAMDVDVNGIEALGYVHAGGWLWELSYALLDKSPDYLDGAGDASFYALNYARHRLAGSISRRGDSWALRLDLEYREQQENLLRSGPDNALFLHAYGSWTPPGREVLQLYVHGRNLTDEDFQSLPGTPGARREWQAGVQINW